MSGYDRQETMPRRDDGRRATGLRVLFNKQTETDAWYAARMLKRLTPEHVRAVRLLAESFLAEQAIEAADQKGKA